MSHFPLTGHSRTRSKFLSVGSIVLAFEIWLVDSETKPAKKVCKYSIFPRTKRRNCSVIKDRVIQFGKMKNMFSSCASGV